MRKLLVIFSQNVIDHAESLASQPVDESLTMARHLLHL